LPRVSPGNRCPARARVGRSRGGPPA
jgi:hypothetical protein